MNNVLFIRNEVIDEVQLSKVMKGVKNGNYVANIENSTITISTLTKDELNFFQLLEGNKDNVLFVEESIDKDIEAKFYNAGTAILKGRLADHILQEKTPDKIPYYKEIINGVDLTKKDLRKSAFPIDKNFFQNIKNKSVSGSKLPKLDLRKYNTEGVDFSDCIFHEDTILKEDFFQKLKNTQIRGATLPAINFSNIDIQDCTFEFIKFHKDTIYPDDKYFFKKFNLLYGCKFINYDYRKFDFSNLNIKYCFFPNKAKLPPEFTLYKKVTFNKFPNEFIENAYLVPLNWDEFEEIIEKHRDIFTDEEISIMYLKGS